MLIVAESFSPFIVTNDVSDVPSTAVNVNNADAVSLAPRLSIPISPPKLSITRSPVPPSVEIVIDPTPRPVS